MKQSIKIMNHAPGDQICRPWHLCGTTVPHYNAVLSHTFYLYCKSADSCGFCTETINFNSIIVNHPSIYLCIIMKEKECYIYVLDNIYASDITTNVLAGF